MENTMDSPYINNVVHALRDVKLNKIAETAKPIIIFYGAWSFGRIFLFGILGASKGAVTGLFIAPESEKNILDTCFDGIEETGVFIWRKSIALIREGLKGAISEIACESVRALPKWCQLYKAPPCLSIRPPTKAANDGRASPNEVREINENTAHI